MRKDKKIDPTLPCGECKIPHVETCGHLAPKRLYIKTFGCQMSKRDSEALTGLLLDRGYLLGLEAESADIILVNTCSVRGHAEDRAKSYLGSLKKSQWPMAKGQRPTIGLIGCMARNKGEEIFKKMRHVDLICGPGSFGNIPAYIDKILNQKIRILDIEDKERKEILYSSSFKLEKDHAHVVISTGCSNFCSYCVVPYVRGKLRLRKPEDIIDEIKRNVALGIKRITLLGQNVNDYEYNAKCKTKSEKCIKFVDLLKMVEKVEGIDEIDFITSQPKNTSKELFAFMAKSSKMKKSLHIPFQSGSDHILKLMNRGYSRAKYLKLVGDYKKIVGGDLSTDVIVGFPTESDKDFKETKDILEKVKFKKAYIFKYSPRPTAKSVKLKDDVPQDLKKKRHKILLDLQKKISSEHK